MDERIKKIEIAMNDEDFVEKVAKCNTAEELQDAFSAKSIEMTMDEINEIVASVKGRNLKNEEIGEADLDNVAGGFGLLTAGAIVVGSYVAGRLYGKYARNKLGSLWG